MSREKGKAKEDGEAQPLSDVTQDISGGGLGIVVGLGHPVILAELLQALKFSFNLPDIK